MKRKFMKKALAVVLSTAMAFSLSSAAEMKTASAAKKFVGLNTTFKTLKVGQKDYKLKLVNNTAKWKINKVSTTDKTIATVYGKTASYVLLKGKGEGRATIKLSLKTTARKKNNTKTLRCRVKVVPVENQDPGTTTPDPGTTTPDPVETNAVVKNQAELDAALAKATVTNIKIDTTDAAKFVIPAGDHKGVDLTVNAPNSDVENSGVFKSITISAIKDSTWLERALGNRVNFNAPKGRFVVAEGASVAGITLTAANSEVKLEVNGTLAGVTVNVSVKLTITGITKVKVPVTVAAGAKGATVDTAVPTEVKAAADVNVTLQSGAAGSTVQVTEKGANVTTENKTGSTVTVTDANNKTTNVSTGSTNKVTGTTSTTPGGNGGGSSSNVGGSTNNRPSTPSSSQAPSSSSAANSSEAANSSSAANSSEAVSSSSAANSSEAVSSSSAANSSEATNSSSTVVDPTESSAVVPGEEESSAVVPGEEESSAVVPGEEESSAVVPGEEESSAVVDSSVAVSITSDSVTFSGSVSGSAIVTAGSITISSSGISVTGTTDQLNGIGTSSNPGTKEDVVFDGIEVGATGDSLKKKFYIVVGTQEYTVTVQFTLGNNSVNVDQVTVSGGNGGNNPSTNNSGS